ncbi:hypothetical protein BDZ89DRAFT_1046332 [Hymenopellis radicata]|nr:hypothetical protein BDZ89DRAFT_1046332 [Hymenopellis radicata]
MFSLYIEPLYQSCHLRFCFHHALWIKSPLFHHRRQACTTTVTWTTWASEDAISDNMSPRTILPEDNDKRATRAAGEDGNNGGTIQRGCLPRRRYRSPGRQRHGDQGLARWLCQICSCGGHVWMLFEERALACLVSSVSIAFEPPPNRGLKRENGDKQNAKICFLSSFLCRLSLSPPPNSSSLHAQIITKKTEMTTTKLRWTVRRGGR